MEDDGRAPKADQYGRYALEMENTRPGDVTFDSLVIEYVFCNWQGVSKYTREHTTTRDNTVAIPKNSIPNDNFVIC